MFINRSFDGSGRVAAVTLRVKRGDNYWQLCGFIIRRLENSRDMARDTENTCHLDWTNKQGRILTANGKALQYYSEQNGYPYTKDELPHYYLEEKTSHSVLKKWAAQQQHIAVSSPIVGAWDRPLFAGQWEHSTNDDETVYNIQTKTLFVDLRIPKSKPIQRWEKLRCGTKHNRNDARQALQRMSNEDLRLFARQHVFGGYSMIKIKDRTVCTRHHCIDWNYISGKPRPRPNKWYIEANTEQHPCNVWKEWSFATDEHKQSYYYERWERIKGDEAGKGFRLAMRRKMKNGEAADGIMVVVGDHFNYILGRNLNGREVRCPPNANNLVELVDAALENNDRETAISYLTLDGGHGTVSSGWKIDCAIQPWNHSINLFDRICGVNGERVRVQVEASNDDFAFGEVRIGNTDWEVYECSETSASALEKVFNCNPLSKM